MCKSVSELSSVTGIDEQLILAKLLQDESISALQTRGLYNTVFNRKSEDGFSIDRPLSTWTMLLSRLIMIEVDTVRGRGLIRLTSAGGPSMGLSRTWGLTKSRAMCVFAALDCRMRSIKRRMVTETETDLTKATGNKHAKFI